MHSSPFPDDLDSVRVHVEAGSPLAELFLIDHDLALVARSVGDLELDVAPGVYKVKAKLGEASAEEVVLLNQDQRVDLSGALSMLSPAPLAGTARTHEQHQHAAAQQSDAPALQRGHGATIFLMVRRWSSDDPRGTARTRPGAELELSLRRADGERIFELEPEAAGDLAAGQAVAVDPGAYLLRWRGVNGALVEQSVRALRGWQTQVFLLDDAPVETSRPRHRVSMLISRSAFDANDVELRRTEEARAALAAERKVASDAINEALFAKFENPLLGLFGAHLMLLARDALVDEAEGRSNRSPRAAAPVGFRQELFDTVVANLGDLLGSDDPDVIALATETTRGREAAPPPIDAPPLLWRSWSLLIDASNRWPELVPIDVWEPIRAILPVRPFLAWSPEVGERAAQEHIQSEIERMTQTERHDVAALLTSRLLAPRAAVDELIGGTSS
jgi:hypothetical protein